MEKLVTTYIPEEPLKSVVVIYHAFCPDGYASMWVARRYFKDDASYIALRRGEELVEELAGRDVYMLDFSYDTKSLNRIEEIANKFVVIDHHISNKDAILKLKEHVFDLNYSGAYLTWNYFNQNEKVPLAIEYISADDTGAFDTLPNQNYLSFYLTSLPLDLDSYTNAFEEFSSGDLSGVLEKARLLKNYQQKIIDACYDSLHYVVFEGYTIPAVNASLPITETSELLRKIYTEHKVPFALRYRYDDGQWKCSLRGDGSVDVSLLALKYGGGGHKGSAGFSVSADFPLPFASLTKEGAIL